VFVYTVLPLGAQNSRKNSPRGDEIMKAGVIEKEEKLRTAPSSVGLQKEYSNKKSSAEQLRIEEIWAEPKPEIEVKRRYKNAEDELLNNTVSFTRDVLVRKLETLQETPGSSFLVIGSLIPALFAFKHDDHVIGPFFGGHWQGVVGALILYYCYRVIRLISARGLRSLRFFNSPIKDADETVEALKGGGSAAESSSD
jgi:hypothetical protein